MSRLKTPISTWIFALFIVTSLLTGLGVPAFYDWTDSDQSRPSPLLLLYQVPLALLALGVIACVVLPWLPIADPNPKPTKRASLRFNVRTLLLVTMVFAICLAVFRIQPLLAVSVGIQVICFALVARVLYQQAKLRIRITALLACMIGPFSWILPFEELENLWPEILWIVAGLPAYYPTLWIGSLFQLYGSNLNWLPFLLTGIELLVGLVLLQQGPKRTIAYLIFVLLSSLLGSLVLNAMVRM